MADYIASSTDKLAPNPARHVTFDDVKRTIERLRAAGAKVSTITVHAELGRGSKTTICKHYAAFMASTDASAPEASPPLPATLLADIGNEINKQVRARTLKLSEELEDAQKSLLAVVAESESYRAAAEEAELLNTALQLSLAERTGVVEALSERAKLHTAQIAQLNEDAESARQSLAISHERLRVSEERFARLESDKERFSLELIDARTDSAKLKEQLEESLRECASFRATAESSRKTTERLDDALREQALLKSQLAETRSLLASSEAQRQGLAERLKDAQAAQARAEATCEQLLQEVLGNRDSLTEPHNLTTPAVKGRDHEGVLR